MNFLHKVGVLFHAQDRLSKSMDHFGRKFTELDKKQKLFERHQVEAARNAVRCGRQISAANDGISRSYTKMTAAGQNYNRFVQRSTVTTMRSLAQLANAQRRNDALNEKFMLAQQLRWDKYAATAKALSTKLEAIETQRDRNLEKLRQAHLARMEAMNKDYDAKHAAARAAQARADSSVAMLRRRGATLIDGSPVAIQDRLDRERARLSRMGGRLNDVRATWATQGRSDADIATMSKSYTRQMQQIEKLIRLDEKRLLDHHRLTAAINVQTEAEAHLGRVYSEQLAEQTALTKKLAQSEARLVALAEERTLAARAGNAVKLEAIAKEMGLADKQHGELMQQKARQLQVAREIHAQTMTGLEAEHAMRQTLMRDQIRQTYLAEMHAAAVELGAATAAETAAIESRKARYHSGLAAASAGAMAGGTQVMTGLMSLGVLGWAGNHFVHSAAENEALDTNIRMNLFGRRDHKGALWSDKLIQGVNANNGRIPGTNMLMDTVSQKHIVEEQLGAAIPPEHILKNLPHIMKLQRYFEVRGKKPGTHFSRDIATILERLQAFSEKDTLGVLNSIAKTSNVSSRATPAAIADVLKAAGPYMLKQQMNLRDISFLDPLLAANPSGSQVGTRLSSVLATIDAGGMTSASRLRLNDMVQKGYWGPNSTLGKKTFSRSGKVNMDKEGAPRINLAGRTLKDAIMPFIYYGLDQAGVKRADFMAGRADSKKLNAAGRFASLALGGAKQGSGIMIPFFAPTEMRRQQEERAKWVAAPGLEGSTKSQSEQYKREFKNMTAAWEEFKTQAGTALLPTMTQFIKGMTSMTISLTKFIKEHPQVVSGLFTFTEWMIKARIALGALNFFGMGIPNAIAKGIGSAVAEGLVIKAAEKGVGSLLIRAIGMIGILGIATALSALIYKSIVWASGKHDGAVSKAHQDRFNQASARAAGARAEAYGPPRPGPVSLTGTGMRDIPMGPRPKMGLPSNYGRPQLRPLSNYGRTQFALERIREAPMALFHKAKAGMEDLYRNWQVGIAAQRTWLVQLPGRVNTGFIQPMITGARNLGSRMMAASTDAGARFARLLKEGIPALVDRFIAGIKGFFASLWARIQGMIPGMGGSGGGGAGVFPGGRGAPPGGGTLPSVPIPRPAPPPGGFVGPLQSSTGGRHEVILRIKSDGPIDPRLHKEIASTAGNELRRAFEGTGLAVRLPNSSIHQQGYA